MQAAQVVLIALFELNTPEFTMLLGALPKTFQDGTTKLLHNHLRSTSASISMVRPAQAQARARAAAATLAPVLGGEPLRVLGFFTGVSQ